MRLTPGTIAPDFTAYDYLGNPVSLKEFHHQKLLLSFLRGAPCPFCNLRVHQLIKNYQAFSQQGIRLLVFFAAEGAEIREYAGKQNSPIQILADPKLKVYKKYGVESSIRGMAKAMINPGLMLKVMTSRFFNLKSVFEKPLIPADFLLDQNHFISAAYYGSNFGDHMDLSTLID